MDRMETKSTRRKTVKTPGANVVFHYDKKKVSRAICSSCKTPLAGVPRMRPHEINNLSKTQRRPERAFGGVLCPRCLEQKIKEKVMVTENDSN